MPFHTRSKSKTKANAGGSALASFSAFGARGGLGVVTKAPSPAGSPNTTDAEGSTSAANVGHAKGKATPKAEPTT